MPDIFKKNIEDLYQGNIQYVIPPYQRTITWPENQWSALFQDIINLVERPNSKHLFQIFQLKKTIHNEAVEVGDGQQRLVQTSLVLAALAHKIQEIRIDSSISNEILEELKDIQSRIMPFKDDFSTQGLLSFAVRRQKRLPRIKTAINNRKIYDEIILWDSGDLGAYKNYKEDNIVVAAFRFYLNAITNYLTEKNITQKLEDIRAILSATINRLTFAVAYFEKDEDMQASYEATNSRGVALTNSELIKHHIFQEFSLTEQEELVKSYWKKYDDENYWINKPAFVTKGLAKPKKDIDNLDTVFTYDILSKDSGRHIDFNKYSIFENFKRYHSNLFQSNHLYKADYYRTYLKNLNTYTSIYERFIFRSDQTTPGLKSNNVKESSYSFTVQENRYWEFYQRIAVGCKSPAAAMTLLFALIGTNKSYDEIDDLMSIIESYFIRKVIVTQSTKNAEVIFLPLINSGISAELLKQKLLWKTDSASRWESDESVLHALKTKSYKQHNRLFTILNIDHENNQKNVTREYSQKVEYKNQTLEHFMPQNPSNPEDGWPLSLPDGVTREDITYNFGNFILLPGLVNTEVANWSHSKKVEHFKKDANELKIIGVTSIDKILRLDKWGYEEIIDESKKKGTSILKKYTGPEKTSKGSQVKMEMDKGNILPYQKVFIDLMNGQSKQVGVVNPEGYIDLVDGSKSESFTDIKRRTFKDVSDKQKTLRYES